MPSNDSEKALRRLITELATVTVDDRQAILAELDVKARQAVENLLARYNGEPAGAGVLSPNRTTVAPEGLSPWLLARLGVSSARKPDGKSAGYFRQRRPLKHESVASYSMTTTAIEGLRLAAARLQTSAPRGEFAETRAEWLPINRAQGASSSS